MSFLPVVRLAPPSYRVIKIEPRLNPPPPPPDPVLTVKLNWVPSPLVKNKVFKDTEAVNIFLLAKEAVPNKDPVIPPVLNIIEPDIRTSFPAACIRLLLLLSSVPLPTIKAAGIDDVAFHWPCTC